MNKNLYVIALLALLSAPVLHAGALGKKKEAKPKKNEVICIKNASNRDCIKACKKKGLNAATTNFMPPKSKYDATKKCKKIENVCNCITIEAPRPTVAQIEGGFDIEIENVVPMGVLLESLPSTPKR